MICIYIHSEFYIFFSIRPYFPFTFSSLCLTTTFHISHFTFHISHFTILIHFSFLLIKSFQKHSRRGWGHVCFNSQKDLNLETLL
jgi:hypothetical protein